MTSLNALAHLGRFPRRALAVALGGLLLPTSLASAQQAQAPLPPVPDVAVEEAAPAEEHVAPSEMIRRSSRAVERMRKALKIILSKLEEARDSKDVIKLNCVNDRLTDVKSMLRISEQADVALQEAIARQDLSQARSSLGTVEANDRKTEQLATESDQCIGLLAFDTAGTKLTVEEPEVDFWEDDSALAKAAGTGEEGALELTARPVTASPVE